MIGTKTPILSVDECKALLKALQEKIVDAQAEAFCVEVYRVLDRGLIGGGYDPTALQ